MGVFCPVLQSILGIILFLRMPYVVGNVGFWWMLIIIFICKSGTLLTTLSMSAIATNGKLRSGGSYYMLSWSLGPATGGAVGILFYFATTLSGSMYIIGAVETLKVASGFTLGPEALHMRLFSVFTLIIIIVINWFGMSWVAKTGVVFLSIVVLSIFSILIGLMGTGKLDWGFFKSNWDS